MGEIEATAGGRPGEWLVRAVRAHGDASAGAEVAVRAVEAPGPESPSARLAGGRAWLEVGEELLAAGDVDGAIACARAGLEEVGPDYAPESVRDDTRLKLSAAEERIDLGHAGDGAAVLLDVLRIRTALLAERHAGTIAA